MNYNLQQFTVEPNAVNYLPDNMSYNQLLEKVSNGLNYQALLTDSTGGPAITILSLIGLFFDSEENLYTAEFYNNIAGVTSFTAATADEPLVLDLTL